MGASYQWDPVFPDGDIYKSGRGEQALDISPETDTVVVYFPLPTKAHCGFTLTPAPSFKIFATSD